MALDTPESHSKGVKRTRGRSGCLNCRARRKKCDETKPTCSRCQSRNDSCKWDEAFPFRSTIVSGEQSGVIQSQQQKTRSELQIVDVTFDTGSKRRKTRHSQTQGNPKSTADAAATPANAELDQNVNQENETSRSSIDASSDSHAMSNPVPAPHLRERHPADPSNHEHTSVMIEPIGSHSDTLRPVDAGSARNNHSKMPGPASDVRQSDGTDLEALDYLTSHTSNIDMLASAVQMGDVSTWSPETDFTMLNVGDSLSASSPDMYSMYYPNAQYRELHSTLHQHMVQTARNTALNRQTSPEPALRDTIATGTSGASFIVPSISSAPSRGFFLKCDLATPRRQLELWRNYLDEIAPWLDMFDNNCHFQTTLPLMAKSAPHLHYSILSLSARQMERRSSERAYTESLGLYQHAIQMIVHRLQNLETEVIASCVLLCVLEMMSSSPRAWARHLDGCAMLLEAAGINGAVGGVRQAIFWCFARMDLWGGYLGDTITKIPTNRWFIPSGSMAMAVSQFKDGSSADAYANYAVFLCASVVNVISTQEVNQAGKRLRPTQTPDLYSNRWKALYDLLEDWYNDRPEELLPLMNEQTAVNDYQHPFPIVLYATSPGCSGNQMYHAAALLMLQHKPKDSRLLLPKTRKSILWHARQICGIAVSNADHSAWTNALQPLWMAGKVMSHPSEHQAILEVLGRIEKETGFATEWRANDLKEYWGDSSE